MAKITIENMENLIKVEVFFHLLPLPDLPICWRQKQANLPIAGGKGNYRQNGMYSPQWNTKMIGLILVYDECDAQNILSCLKILLSETR